MTVEGLQHGVPLAPLTTLGVGGPARWLLRWRTVAELRDGLAFAVEQRVPWWLLGGGSNVIIADTGLPGVVLQPAGHALIVGEAVAGNVRVSADAGVVWDELVARTVACGLGGLECLSGIPGLVGSAPIQNIGAYGQDVSEVIDAVEVLDARDGTSRVWQRADCAFGYRDSVWKREPGRWIVTRVHLRLRAQAAPCLAYAQVAQALAGVALAAGTPGLTSVRQTVLQLRRAKGMVVDPTDPDSRSVGSFFVNPTVAPVVAARVQSRLAPQGSMPMWPSGECVKLSAAWLIEHSGLSRGFGAGRVGLSSKHTLAIVNRGGATAVEVLSFANDIVACVETASGVRLEREPVLLGF